MQHNVSDISASALANTAPGCEKPHAILSCSPLPEDSLRLHFFRLPKLDHFTLTCLQRQHQGVCQLRHGPKDQHPLKDLSGMLLEHLLLGLLLPPVTGVSLSTGPWLGPTTHDGP